jgi:hypothetical protein
VAISINLKTYLLVVWGTILIFIGEPCFAQELEPRALTNLPVGMNFAVVGYGFAHGNILFDPGLPLEDATADFHSIIGAYARAINFFGLSGKVDVIVPYGIGKWSGVFTGIDTSTTRSGFGDIRFRISVNFLGAPALKAKDFAEYRPDKISGFSLQIIAPTGQYFPDRLINLGSNRWVFKPQWGFAKHYEKWIWETYLRVWLFTKNNDFWGGNEVKQKPLYAIKIHGIRKFNNKSWLAFDIGYGNGARSLINDELKDNSNSTFRFGVSYAVPLGIQHNLKFTWISDITLEKGADFDALGVSYQYRWLKK